MIWDVSLNETAMEIAGAADGVLTNHRVGDEENLRGLQLALQFAQLAHQRVVNVQPAGGVHQNHVAGGELRFADGAAGNFKKALDIDSGNVDATIRIGRHPRGIAVGAETLGLRSRGFSPPFRYSYRHSHF